MKIKTILCASLTLGLLAACVIGCATAKEKQAKLEAQAKVTRPEAEKIALAQVPNGTLKDGEIENENGKLIWSFDVATPDSKDITEVAVDAITGKVISMDKETP